MSQQVLSGPTSHAVGDAAAAVAAVIGAPLAPETLARLHETAWPMADAESLRGVALLAESRLSEETFERIDVDHRRLFVGGQQRGPVAPLEAPPIAAPAFARLRFELTRAGVVLPSATGADLADALHALATLLTGSGAQETARWRAELLDEHLLSWGTRCLSRVQLGAQTFCYQGVAALGLGLLRRAAER